ncbi:MAG TPA: hypothetical protein VGA06_00025 [Candidatus Paceibacterota bacterium]|jgi:hypothetical protein
MQNRGYITILVLVFSAVFLTLITSLAGFIFIQQKVQLAKENREKAVQIAEAGLDYYRWFLAHFPDDLENGTGLPGPYEIDYADPEGGNIGTFSLEIEGNEQCAVVSSIDITSTGSTDADPTFKRTVFGRYARPSVAEYAYIVNSNVWAGADRVINGRYHSNGGIRMDGDNRSTVTSAVDSWLCTSSFGCSPSSNEDGVFGGGTNPELWEFPAAPIDFVGLTVDLAAMKDQAKANGLYLEPTAKGKRIVFLPDGTIDVYIVNSTAWVWGYSTEEGWHQDRHIITNDSFVGNFALPANCQLIFAESDVWLEGEVSNKVTIASANLINANIDTSIILNGNITYTTTDGSVGLTAIAEEDVLVPLLSPENMTLRGILIAQNGRFGRNHYTTSGSNDVPSQYDSYVKQGTLTITGTIVSNGRVGTRWTSGGTFVSGYNDRLNYYDRNLAAEPPPLTPFVSSDFTFIEWREEN